MQDTDDCDFEQAMSDPGRYATMHALLLSVEEVKSGRMSRTEALRWVVGFLPPQRQPGTWWILTATPAERERHAEWLEQFCDPATPSPDFDPPGPVDFDADPVLGG